jgi:TRAP-type C4-dicarboxylate transport system permease small subunit
METGQNNNTAGDESLRVTLAGHLSRLTDSTSMAFNWVACGAMIAMLLMAAVDLVGIKVFKWNFAGAFEAIGLLGLILVAFAIPHTHVQKGHIAIDILTNMLPKRAQALFDVFITLLILALFAPMTWQMFIYGLRLQEQGAVSATQRLPLEPLAYASAACFLLMCLVLIVQAVSAFRGVIKWKTTSSD